MREGLVVSGLTVMLGGATVLDDIGIELKRGGFYGLIGRNGAGKTTLMRSIMGLLRPQSGSICFDDLNLCDQKAFERAPLGIGYMPEGRGLVPQLSVDDNIMLPSWATGSAETEARFNFARQLIPELNDFEKRKASELSGGQQKLVSLGRALTMGKKLLLLDEPLEGVAPALAGRLMQILSELRLIGSTILIAESEQKHVARLLDQAFLIERGRINTIS